MIIVRKEKEFGKQSLLVLLGMLALLISSIAFGAKAVPPTITSPTTGTITGTTAVLGGTVTDIGSDPINAVGVEWSTTSGGPYTLVPGTYPGLNTPFTVAVTGLTENITYYWRAYATNTGNGTNRGTTTEQSFTTPSSSVVPTVSTPTFTSVTDTTAVLGGNVTANGGAAVTDRGIEWGTSSGTYTTDVPFGQSGTGLFSSTVNSLTAGTQIFFRAWALNASGRGYSTETSFTTDPAAVVPTVSSPTFASVTDSTAVLGGNVTANGGAAVTDRGIEWGTTSGIYPNDVPFTQAGTGIFSKTVVGLAPGTQIFFRAWALNTVGRGYSTESSFTTDPPPAVPTVDTPTATSITTSSAVLGGTVSNDGGGTITERGTVWGLATNPDIVAQSDNVNVVAGTLGTFSGPVSGLPAGTVIHYRAYATNSTGTAYSPDSSFITLVDLPIVDSPTVASITSTSAFLGGTVTSDGGDPAGITERGTVWGTSPSPTGNILPEGGTSVGVPFSHLRDFLPTGVTVYFRAYATNSEGTAYSADSSFVPSEPPILSLPTATNITYFSAVLGGTIDNDGGNPILSRGTVWNTTGTTVTENAQAEGGTATGVFAHTRFLPLGTTVYYRAYATSSVGTGYSPQGSFTTSFEPTVQASNITFPRVAARSLRIQWTPGNGEGSMVVLRTGTQVHPADNTDYTANPDFTLGEDIGSGNIVVYKGSNNVVVVTGLTELTTYHVSIYDYAGTGINTYYLGPPEQPPAEASQVTTDIRVHNLDYGIDCNDCHNSHGEFLPHDTVQQVVCETCHNPSGQASNKLEFGLHLTPNKNPAVDYVDCGSCHELHNPGGANTTESLNAITGLPGVNKSFLRANVEKYVPTAIPGAGALQNDTYDAADPLSALTPERAIEGGDDTTARGYCQVCHSLTNYHRSTNTAGSNQCHNGEGAVCPPVGEVNCGTCHQHNNKFIGSGGTQTCMECHASAQGNRPIITTQFDRLSHHVPGTLDEFDCEVCHDQGGHQGGQITLWNADNHALPSYQQPTANASTLATGEGVAFEGHCLSCHDSNGAQDEATPLSPFNGSGAPPVISTAGWNTAGHKSATAGKEVTCLGDGTNGCHGSGHGSEKLTLLAPATTGPTAPADFCFVCHDSDGPSSHDIQFQFGSPTPDASKQTLRGSVPVNQRHDIYPLDQAYSGGSVTCKDCHSPHVDSSTNPVADPDTTLPLATYSPTNSYTDDGYNFSYGGGLDPVNPAGSAGGFSEPDNIQFCLTCHDGTAPASVTMTSGLIDIASDYSAKQHGSGSGATGCRPGKGYLKVPWTTQAQQDGACDPDTTYAAINCTTCHGAHGSPNIFNLRESITVAGVEMTVGSLNGSGEFPVGSFSDPDSDLRTYTLPVNGGTQADHVYGAWCTFCHEQSAHAGVDETTVCTSAHMHGSNSF